MKRLVIFLLVALIPLMAVPQDPISRPGKKKQNTTQTTNTSQKRKQQEAEKRRKAEQARKAERGRKEPDVPEQASSPVERSGLGVLPSRGSKPQGGISPIVSYSSDFLRKNFVSQK